MATRNFHKRRTKERKDRQRAERLAERRAARSKHLPRVDPFALGAGMAVAAASLLGGRTLRQDMPPHAPRLFVKDGKPTPFDYL